jgi:hypothetical protein
MMGRIVWIALATTAVAAVAAGGWWVSGPVADAALGPAPLRHSTGTEIGALQLQANAACRCARSRGGSPWREDCWAEFHRSLTPFEHSDVGTMCREESISEVCFGDGFAGEPCVVTGRPYGGCSDEESARLQAQARARRQSGCSD